jgi:hypothetical protein
MNEEREKQRVVTVAAIAVIADISFQRAEDLLDAIIEEHRQSRKLQGEFEKARKAEFNC